MFDGMELLHFNTYQGIVQLEYLIGHYRRGGEIGKMIDITIVTMQLLVGSKKTVLELGTTAPTYLLKDLWITLVWEFLEEAKGGLTFTRNYVPPKQ